jgi:transcriptional regulator with XRE-family HTH domain
MNLQFLFYRNNFVIYFFTFMANLKQSKFRSWIYSEGGTLEVSEKLGVSRATVQHWLRRRATPRLEVAQKIIRLSKGKLTVTDIINATMI